MRAAKLLAVAVCLGALLPVAAMAGPARVLILPVVVHSASPDPDYVSRGLSDMLSARLEQLGGVRVVHAAEQVAPTARTDEAVAAARRAGGDYVVFGSFTQFGDGASLDLRCAPVAGGDAPRSIFIQSGTMGEIIPKLDNLADKVARYVRGEPVASGPAAAPVTSDAPEFDELKRRLEALERAVFPPVAEASEEPAAEATEEVPES